MKRILMSEDLPDAGEFEDGRIGSLSLGPE
jgi:hypothetical protein